MAAAIVLAPASIGCGGGESAANERVQARAALRSTEAVDRAVRRVEARARASAGPSARRARATRLLLESWYGQHAAVFAVDPQAAGGRVRAVLDGLAAISPSLVTRDPDRTPVGLDRAAIARVLKPDGGTRKLAQRERRAIERELGRLAEALGEQPATTVIAGEAGPAGGETVDDLLIALEERLRLLYPDLAAEVRELRIELPR